MPRRYAVNLFESADKGAFVRELQTLRYLRYWNAEIGEKKDRITAFTLVDIFDKRLVCVFFELTAQVALVVTYRVYYFLYAFGHKVFAVEIDEQLRQPRRIFDLRVPLILHNRTQNVRYDYRVHHLEVLC